MEKIPVQNPRETSQIYQKALQKCVNKASKLLSDNNFNINAVNDQIEVEIEKISEKNNLVGNLEYKQILKLALEQIHEEQSIFPNNLEDAYLDLLSNTVLEMKQDGNQDHEIIREIVVSLRPKGIKIDNDKLTQLIQNISIDKEEVA